MRNKQIKIKKSIVFTPVLVLVFAFIAVSTSCSVIGGFNRNTAASMIEKDPRYNKPAAMTIDISGRLPNGGANTPQKSADETAEEAAIRAKQEFMQRQPQLLVAEELGYIKLYFEKPELSEREMGAPRFDDSLKHWYFKPRAEITEAGKALWKDLNLAVDEESLPLAVRGTPEVTGMKDERQTTKTIDFTYKWEPNDLGKSFDSSSNEFKKLTPALQEVLEKTQTNLFGGRNNVMDFKTPRSGKSVFQKFDDGWRLGQLYFM